MLDDVQVKEWQSLLARAVNITLGKDGGPDDDGLTVGRLLEALEELAVERAPLTVNMMGRTVRMSRMSVLSKIPGKKCPKFKKMSKNKNKMSKNKKKCPIFR